MKKKAYYTLAIMLLIACGILGSIVGSNRIIESSARGNNFSDISKLDNCELGLVLGASAKTRNGGDNPFFVNRIKAAAELYHAGKIKYLLVSGDNGHKSYDEPTDMKMALMKLGVPASKIYMDYAGFRTWDSIIRCKLIFGQKKFIIISQKFHNKRALYIAKHYNCDAQAYNASDVRSRVSTKREYLARVKLMVDILIKKSPHFLGKKIEIGKPQLDINA
jgi:SanA protein